MPKTIPIPRHEIIAIVKSNLYCSFSCGVIGCMCLRIISNVFVYLYA